MLGSVLIDLTYMSSGSWSRSGCATQRDDNVLAGALVAEPVVADVCEPLGFLEPSGFHDLASGAGEHGRGHADEFGEVGACFDDGAVLALSDRCNSRLVDLDVFAGEGIGRI